MYQRLSSLNVIKEINMDNNAFKKAYEESRNGCNGFYRHPMAKRFHYSDGVQECAEAGCHWLVDIAATELPKAMRDAKVNRSMFEVTVKNGKAHLRLTAEDAAPPIWKRSIEYTDMPEGEYVFELVDEGERVAMILLTEH